MSNSLHTRTINHGRDRILLGERNQANVYYELTIADGWNIRTEIVWVRSARIAYNNAIKRVGRNLLNITNLETGQLVFGSAR